MGGTRGAERAARSVASSAAATRIAQLLGTLFEDVLLVGDGAPHGAPGRRVEDRAGPASALRGLVTALEAAGAPRVLVVRCDLANLSPDILLALVAWPEADAVVPRDRRGDHPLCAIYARDAVLPPARAALAARDLELSSLLAAVETHTPDPADLARVDPDGRARTPLSANPAAG